MCKDFPYKEIFTIQDYKSIAFDGSSLIEEAVQEYCCMPLMAVMSPHLLNSSFVVLTREFQDFVCKNILVSLNNLMRSLNLRI